MARSNCLKATLALVAVLEIPQSITLGLSSRHRPFSLIGNLPPEHTKQALCLSSSEHQPSSRRWKLLRLKRRNWSRSVGGVNLVCESCTSGHLSSALRLPQQDTMGEFSGSRRHLTTILTTSAASMMLNTSQNLDAWQTYFNTPSGSKLGLMNAIYQIGSLASFPFV